MLFAIGFIFLFTHGRLHRARARDHAGRHPAAGHLLRGRAFPLRAGGRRLFAFFGGIYFWLPKWTGRMYNETLGKWHFWLSMIFFNITFFPMHFLGLAGMPRRIPDYAMQFADFNMIASIGAFGFGAVAAAVPVRRAEMHRGDGEKAPAKPWEGADTLEWTLPSPRAVSHFRDAAVSQRRREHVDRDDATRHRWQRQAHQRAQRTALILASIALVFFVGIIVRILRRAADRHQRAGRCGAGVPGGRHRPESTQMSDARRSAETQSQRCCGSSCVIVVAMFGFGFALVPFYERSARSTGLRNIAQCRRGRNTQVDARARCASSSTPTCASCRGRSGR